MPRTIFSWLHLSDIHANHGSAEHHANQQHILRAIVADLGTAIKVSGAPKPNAILVTGDIAFSGNTRSRSNESVSTEYARAKEWLLEVATAVELQRIAIFCVPGNHDVARTNVDKDMFGDSLTLLRAGKRTIDDALARPAYQVKLRERMAEYLQFCNDLNPACADLASWQHKIITASGIRICLVGLNTSLLCNDDEDHENLYVGESQLLTIPRRQAANDEIVITMSHHPLEKGWLADEEVAATRVRNHSHIHLAGHEHLGKSRDQKFGGGHRHIIIDAGAVHEDARPRREPYSHSYNIAAIVQEDTGELFVRIWPRIWESTTDSFIVDQKRVDSPNPFAEHPLAIQIKTNTNITNAAANTRAGDHDAELDRLEMRFRDLIIQSNQNLKVRMPSAEPLELKLENVYVNLRVVAKTPRLADTFSIEERRVLALLDGASGPAAEALWQEFDSLQYDRQRTQGAALSPISSPCSILEYLANPSHRAVVVLGDPGSGKTTMLQMLALNAARASKIGINGEHVEAHGKTWLPILVRLAGYDAHLGDTKASTPLREYLRQHWPSQMQFPNAWLVLERALKEGRALILLDGLDEVMTRERRTFVVGQVEGFIRNEASAGNRFVITSRYVGYRQAGLAEEFAHLSVLDFGEREVETFLARWYEALEARVAGSASDMTRSRATVEREAMLAEIKGNAQLLALAKNPLQLGMLALLRRQHGQLPTRRIEIFNEFTKMLLDLRPHDRSAGARAARILNHSRPDLRKYLRALALWMQEFQPSRTAKKRDVERILFNTWIENKAVDSTHPTQRERSQAEEASDIVLDELQRVTGMVIERGHDAFGFSHLTYQEFFAAEALASMAPECRWNRVQPVLHHARWRETLLLCAGHLSIIGGRSEEAADLVRSVLNAGSPFEDLLFRDVFMAANMAAEDIELPAKLLNEIRGKIDAPLKTDLDHFHYRVLASISQLAYLGHQESVDWLLRLLKNELPDVAPMLRAQAYNMVSNQLINQKLCKPIADWLRQGAEERIRDVRGDSSWHESFRFGIAMTHFAKTDPDFRRRIIEACDNGWHDGVSSLHFFWGKQAAIDPIVYAALLRWAKRPATRQVALLELATELAEDPAVQQLLLDAWDDLDEHIRQAAMHGGVRLAAKDLDWRKRMLERIKEAERSQDVNTLTAIAGFTRDDEPTRAHYLELMQSDRTALASAAASSLAPLLASEPSVRIQFLSHLTRSEPALRQNAVQHLTAIARTTAATANAIRPLLDDPATAVRHAALNTLAPRALEDEELRDQFAQRLNTVQGCSLAARIDTIAPMIKYDESIRARVLGFLEHSLPQTRIAAIRALEALACDDPEIRSRLADGMEDPDLLVQVRAIQSLRSSISVDNTLLERLATRAATDDSQVQQAALEAIAPFHFQETAYKALLVHLDEHRPVGPIAARIIAEQSRTNSAIRTRVHTWVENKALLQRYGLESVSNLIDAMIEHDQLIFENICKYAEDEHLGRQAMRLALRHPKLLGVKTVLLQYAANNDKIVKQRALPGLAALSSDDNEARQHLLRLLEDKSMDVHLYGLADAIRPLIGDDDVRSRLIEATRPIQREYHSRDTGAMECLVEHVPYFPDIESCFRGVLDEPETDRFGGARKRVAVAGLGPLVVHDSKLRAAILPWLGTRTPDGEGIELRRLLANYLAPIVHDDSDLHHKVSSMLSSVAWQDRQGAAWTLFAAGGDAQRLALAKIGDLLDDERGEESWVERLHAASALLNHPNFALSQKAVAVAHSGLLYGRDPWFSPLGPAVRQQAAAILEQLQPIHPHADLTQHVVRAFHEETNPSVRNALCQALNRLASATELPMIHVANST